MKKLFIALILILLIGCQQSFHGHKVGDHVKIQFKDASSMFNGKYTYRGVIKSMDSETILLDPDRSFEKERFIAKKDIISIEKLDKVMNQN